MVEDAVIDSAGLPAWLAETAVCLTGKEARAVRFGELPQSFKAFHAADETEAAVALVVLWAKVQGATKVDDEAIARLAQHMVVALGVESVAELIRLTKTPKRTRLGNGENACHRRQPKHAHHVWAIDFLMDTKLNGGRLKFLAVIDEFSRSCLSIEVERTLTSGDVVAELERLITRHGPPSFVRCDNGPEFIARATRQFLATADVKTLFI